MSEKNQVVNKRSKVNFEDASKLVFRQQYKAAKTIMVQVSGRYYPTTREVLESKAAMGLLTNSDLNYFTPLSIVEAQKKK